MQPPAATLPRVPSSPTTDPEATLPSDETPFDSDVAVIGSGFGGSVAALRLTEKGYRVTVFEAGRRFGPDDFPETSWDLRRFFHAPRLGMYGIQRLNLLSDVLVLSGAGVGGGSLVYANTLYEPLPDFYTDRQWAGITDWREELAPHYDQAKRMLGAATAPTMSPNDDVIRAIGERMGCADTHRATEVAVYLGTAGQTVADPYFGGAGPDRTGCIRCGGCMTGCRHDAKNTLDHNYLHLAEGAGATVLPERLVTDLVPLDGGGYEIVSERPGPRRGRDVQRHRAEQVVFAAGVLGTIRLLATLRERGRLPHLSDRLGELVRTNSESIQGAAARGYDRDYSTGLAISSSIYPNEHTHIEGVRYGRGSNAMALLQTILVDGGGRLPRPLRFLGEVVRHPIRFLRSLSVRRWSERAVILLVMQSWDNSIRLRWRRTRGGVRLRSEPGHGTPSPKWIPEANEASRHAAEVMGGDPGGSINESLFGIPLTAHILGGCVIGSSPEQGVVDAYHRVFGHEGLHVVDGSSISANLGANPSLTITAQAERAFSFWPNRAEDDPRPPLGAGYERIAPVAPTKPAVPASATASLRPRS